MHYLSRLSITICAHLSPCTPPSSEAVRPRAGDLRDQELGELPEAEAGGGAHGLVRVLEAAEDLSRWRAQPARAGLELRCSVCPTPCPSACVATPRLFS